jgi:hypothetical protein
MPESNLEDLGLENLKMKQTWLQEKTERIKDLYKIDDINDAFRDLSYSLIFDIGINDIDAEEIIDSRQDKQIDIIHIEENQIEQHAHLHILQIKNETGFKSTVVTQIKSGLSWIFSARKEEYEQLENEQFVTKISEIRQKRQDYGPNKISVTVYYVTKGNSKDLSGEYSQEKRSLENIYKNTGFESFEFKEVGAVELFDYLKSSEQSRRKINAKLPILYDVNIGSIIRYSTGETKAMICSTKGKDLAILSKIEPKDAIFDMNVRNFYGIEKNPVNSDIFNTCTSGNGDPSLFWFLNNGITMVCEHFDFTNDPDHPMVDLKNVQIVNGCQTAVTLREAYEKGLLKDSVNVLLRIYETKNPSLTSRITLTTNNQNKIVGRDLKANDVIQSDIQKIMLDRFGYYYERKNREFPDLPPDKKMKIVPNDKAGQAYLAIVGKKPSIARGFLGRIWDQHYDEIFKHATVEDLLLTYMIHNYCNWISKTIKKSEEIDEVQKGVATYGSYHIARVIGFNLVKDKWGSKEREKIKSIIIDAEKNPNYFLESYMKGLGIIRAIRLRDYDKNKQTISYYFKAEPVQNAIENELYSPSKIKKPTDPFEGF